MKVAIIEAEHFQYGLTQSEIYEGHEKLFFVTEGIHKEMHEYTPDLCNGKFYIVPSIERGYQEIIKICREEVIDLLLLSPVFDSYEAVLKIAKSIPCKKVITIHNLNFWFNSNFRTLHAYNERKIKQEIVKAFDYIAVEDFIYNHLKNNDRVLFEKYNFLYIPFTIFHKKKHTKYFKENNSLKIVLPGYIHKERRRYEDIIEVIDFFAKKNVNLTFSFAGRAVEEYGMWVIKQLDKANEIKNGIATYFPPLGEITPEMFLKEMETADLVLSASALEFKALGTIEFIGKTKPTAAIHDMMSFQLPGLLPAHLSIPENLRGSVFNYSGVEELKNVLQNLLDNPLLLIEWKKQAKNNSHYFTASEIRKNLPFFYNQCNRCVMDNLNDTDIWFDKNGHCNYCSDYFKYIEGEVEDKKFTNKTIAPIIEKIKQEGKNKKYDCIVGISGGTDSAFLVHKLVELGLRPLAVHYDNGWNSETATMNIEVLLTKLKVDLYTHVNDWEEFKDLQLSFFKAGVMDIELISDHAITAVQYKASLKYNTNYIFQGHNTNSEFILPKSWFHWKHDALNIIKIHEKYGSVRLKTFPYFSFFREYYHIKFKKTKCILLLNYINYSKREAQEILAEQYGWKNYGAKHNESIFTRFYQNYILPVKFNIDKRKAHLSSLVCSGQISREQALDELKIRIWETAETKQDKEYVIKKLGVTEEVFDSWMKEKPVSHFNYPSYLTRHDKIIREIKKMIGRQ